MFLNSMEPIAMVCSRTVVCNPDDAIQTAVCQTPCGTNQFCALPNNCTCLLGFKPPSCLVQCKFHFTNHATNQPQSIVSTRTTALLQMVSVLQKELVSVPQAGCLPT